MGSTYKSFVNQFKFIDHFNINLIACISEDLDLLRSPTTLIWTEVDLIWTEVDLICAGGMSAVSSSIRCFTFQ